jgi:hypothetical protein
MKVKGSNPGAVFFNIDIFSILNETGQNKAPKSGHILRVSA